MFHRLCRTWAAQAPARRCIALVVAGGLLIFFVRFGLRNETDQQMLRRLGRDLQTQDSGWRRQRVALWRALPPSVAGVIPGWLAPEPIQDLKLRAISQLGKLGPEATPYLISALDDPLIQVRLVALGHIGLRGLGATAATPRLLQALGASTNAAATNSLSSIELSAAVRALGAVASPDPAVVDVLIECINGGRRPELGPSATEAIVRLASRSDHGVEILGKALQKPSEWGFMLVEGLGNCQDDPAEILSALSSWLMTDNDETQRATVRALGRLGAAAAPAVPDLVAVLREQRSKPPLDPFRTPWNGRLRCSRYGVPLGSVAVYSGMPPVLSGGSLTGSLREELIRTFGLIGAAAPEAVPALVEEYRDMGSTLRFEAATARWRIDGALAEILPVFTQGVADPDPTIRLTALRACAELATSTPEVLPLCIKALSDPAAVVQRAALRVCVPLAPSRPEIVPALAKALSDGAVVVRLTALEACAPLAPSTPEIFAAITNALSDPAPEIRLAAIRVCAPLAPSRPEIIGLLTRALSDPEFRVRHAALAGCAPLAPSRPDLVPFLTNVLSDGRASLRLQAARVLGECGSSAGAAVPALTPMLLDTNEFVRTTASNALAAIRKSRRTAKPGSGL